MGEVWLAEQLEPVRRRVALKLIKLGMDTRQVVARFEAERQALAVMDHPGIAQVFDGGATEDGRPYFVMELVHGIPIDDYCDRNRLTTDERTRLFVDVCNAVQHAHHKGVIHRDLKPSNVLVTVKDNKPVVKIIDFGIAKALGQDLTDRTLVTRLDQIIGTPSYMSPEQAEMPGLDVDTRTDVYSLGVLLYELLVGALPIDLRAVADQAIWYAIRETQIPRPSTRLAALNDTQDTVAEQRQTTVDALRKELESDLDWIILKAMEKDRTRRYETANAFAQDLERHLRHEPVEARAPSATYRMGRFIRRHRVGVGFAAVIVSLLTLSTAGMTLQADRIAHARDEAEARRGQAEGLIDFMLTDLRGKLEPLGRLDILDEIGEQALSYFASLPEDQFSDEELTSRSQSLYQIGGVRLDEGRRAEAVAAFAESLRLARELSARAPEDTVRLFGLCQSHFYVGYASYVNGDLEAAEEQFDAYLAVAERLTALAPGNLDYRMEVGFAHSNLGSVREARGDLDGAAEAYRRNLQVEEDLLSRDPSRLDWLGENAETHNKLAVVYTRQGRYREALKEHQRELTIKDQVLLLAPTHAYWRFRRANTHHFLGKLQENLGDLTTAAREHATAVMALDSLVRQDPANARWQRSRALMERDYGRVLSKQGQAAAAIPMLRRSAATIGALADADSSSVELPTDVGGARTELAGALFRARRPAEAALEAAAGRDILAAVPLGSRSARSGLVEALLVLGRARASGGDASGAREAWDSALTLAEQLAAEPGGEEFAPLLAEGYLVLDRLPEARAVLAQLDEGGYREPELWRLASERGVEPKG
jgi:serine/threonine-protein kinase